MSLSTPATRGPQTQGLNRFSLVAIWTLTGLWVLSNIVWILASGSTRDALTAAGVVLLFAASLSHSWATRGTAWTALMFGIACIFGWTIEAVGTATGLPFGEYFYTDRLGWSIADVPILIPLAWAMIAYPIYALAERTNWNRPARIVLSAAILAAWDLFLDPQMVTEGHWVWLNPEPAIPGLSGIPISNFMGWIIAALVLMSLLTLFLPARPDAPVKQPVAALLWIYVGNIVANAIFLDRPTVALVGALGMGIPLAILLARLRRVTHA